MPDYEAIAINNMISQLNEVMHIVLQVKADVEVIKSEQSNIKHELEEHKKNCASLKTDEKGGLQKVMDIMKQWIFPIILAIFLLGRQSVEYTTKPSYAYPKTKTEMLNDDTFVVDRRLDSALIKQIYKTAGPK